MPTETNQITSDADIAKAVASGDNTAESAFYARFYPVARKALSLSLIHI